MKRLPSNSKSKMSILPELSLRDLITLYGTEVLNNMHTPLALDVNELKYTCIVVLIECMVLELL